MEIKKAKFITSAVKPSQYPDDNLPMVAMVGKSNVGKSSLINVLCNNFKLARVSGTPGKTRLVNFFLINEEFYLVDLPGYGFARVSKTEQSSWGKMMEDFFTKAVALKGIILIVDIRHNPTAEDMQMAEWIRYYNVPVVVVASKSDKVGKTKIKPLLKSIKEKLGFDNHVNVVPYSSLTRYGIEDVKDAIELLLTSGIE